MSRTVTVHCKPVRIRVGDYFPAEFEITDAVVAVDVPLTLENFADYDEKTGYLPDPPALTIKGFRWCYNQLVGIFRPDLVPDEDDQDDEEEFEDFE